MIRIAVFIVLIVVLWLLCRPISPKMESTVIEVGIDTVLLRAIGAEPSLESNGWIYADGDGLLEKVATVHVDAEGRKTFIVSDTDLGHLFYEYIAPNDGLKINALIFWPDEPRHFRY